MTQYIKKSDVLDIIDNKIEFYNRECISWKNSKIQVLELLKHRLSEVSTIDLGSVIIDWTEEKNDSGWEALNEIYRIHNK